MGFPKVGLGGGKQGGQAKWGGRGVKEVGMWGSSCGGASCKKGNGLVNQKMGCSKSKHQNP